LEDLTENWIEKSAWTIFTGFVGYLDVGPWTLQKAECNWSLKNSRGSWQDKDEVTKLVDFKKNTTEFYDAMLKELIMVFRRIT